MSYAELLGTSILNKLFSKKKIIADFALICHNCKEKFQSINAKCNGNELKNGVFLPQIIPKIENIILLTLKFRYLSESLLWIL